VVSHGFAMAVLMAHLAGEPFERVWDLIPENGQWVVVDVKMQDLWIEK
jgi:broad specificity phosphatase PhoE